jgi:hypothetical protein
MTMGWPAGATVPTWDTIASSRIASTTWRSYAARLGILVTRVLGLVAIAPLKSVTVQICPLS